MRVQDAADVFEPLRPCLRRIAYRMLGSIADAEDIVQDAFLRWHATDREGVRTPEAFLRRVVTRLCLDVLKSAPRRHETYVGPWLPEPVFEPEAEIDDVTLPLMLALERLSPAERAAFLLHDVFGVEFGEIAETLGREPATCRQLASRARMHVRAARPRHPLPRAQGQAIAEAFFAATRSGDVGALRALLSADVVAQVDSGGRRPAAPRPVVGREAVVEAHAALARLFAEAMSKIVGYGYVNGLPGFMTIEGDGLPQTTALDIRDGAIVTIYVTRNPDKLRHLGAVT